MTSQNFSQARKHMVESQIHTNGVTDDALLSSFVSTPRELFAPEGKRAVCCVDDDLEIAPGRWLVDPAVHARLLQALALTKHDTVLDIACGTGYNAALISPLVSTVVAADSRNDLLVTAESLWNRMSLTNIVAERAELQNGCPQHAPFSVIFFNGAVDAIPAVVLNQLGVGGRLAAVIRDKSGLTGTATLFRRISEIDISSVALFKASTSCLPEFAMSKHAFSL